MVSQGQRCQAVFETRSEALLAKLGDKERKTLVESSSSLGRKWLSTIPWNSTQRLSDFEVSAALHYRTLLPSTSICQRCGALPTLGHSETCSRGSTWKYSRHNAILHTIGDAIKSVDGTRVDIEPSSIGVTNQRNDLRVWGSLATGATNTEHDVKVYSILADHAHSSLVARATSSDLAEGSTILAADFARLNERAKTLAQANRYLGKVAKEAQKNAPTGLGHLGALVFSTGGLVEIDTQKQLASWKEAVGDSAWNWALRRISMTLVRARARTFAM